MILVTVGSMFPFDRLVRAADAIAEQLGPQSHFFAQIGGGSYEPKYMPFVRFVAREEFGGLIAKAEMVISHAGIGTIAETLKFHKPLLVLPRLQSLGEHVNDHQIPTARRFAELGHVLMAEAAEDLVKYLDRLRVFKPRVRQPNPVALAACIGEVLTKGKR